MSAFFIFRLTVTLARRRSKRGIFFLPVATMPCHLKANLICLSSRDFPAPFPLREQVVPSLPWMPGNGPAPPPTPPPGAESGRREDQRVGAGTSHSSAISLSFYPLGAAPEGSISGQTFLSELLERTEAVKI